jgi:hypothetical protein
MYTDPTLIRNIVIPIRLNRLEAELLDAVTNYTGQQKSTLMRELFIEQARMVLAGMGDIGTFEAANEAPQKALNFAR